MKEITRIHLAKIAYDIELDAKKEIQKYIAALERYADDSELLGDIEIRITELLAERGVAAGGVIAADDVAAVRAQLGEPSDFAPEGIGDIAVGSEPDGPEKRVYRDVDGAVLGGVLSGIAKYIGIDPLWARLIFLVVLIASFGTALIVYLILWLVIPPARTAAERLRMSGQPVTLASLKQLGEQAGPAVSESARVLKTVLAVGTGIVLVLVAIGVLIAIPFGVFGLTLYNDSGLISSWSWQLSAWWVKAVVGLFALSGVLFAALCILLATALFRRKWTKKTGVAVAVIIATGLAVFAGGLGVGMYGRFSEQTTIYNSQVTTSVNLPAAFNDMKTLTVEADAGTSVAVRIDYIVADKARWELDALPGVKPQFDIAEDGQSAHVKLVRSDGKRAWDGRDYLVLPVLRIYGPALEHLETEGVANVSYYSEKQQDTLAVSQKSAGFELLGVYGTVMLTNENSGAANLAQATISDLTVRNKGGLVEAGVVRTLAVEQPDVCPGNSTPSEPHSVVRVQAVSGGKLVFNNSERSAQTVSNDCGRVIVGADEETD